MYHEDWLAKKERWGKHGDELGKRERITGTSHLGNKWVREQKGF